VDPSEPLATLDPADRPAARQETSAPEAAAWLADPQAFLDRQAEWNRALHDFVFGPEVPMPPDDPELEEQLQRLRERTNR
jgi:hypothetical protein